MQTQTGYQATAHFDQGTKRSEATRADYERIITTRETLFRAKPDVSDATRPATGQALACPATSRMTFQPSACFTTLARQTNTHGAANTSVSISRDSVQSSMTSTAENSTFVCSSRPGFSSTRHQQPRACCSFTRSSTTHAYRKRRKRNLCIRTPRAPTLESPTLPTDNFLNTRQGNHATTRSWQHDPCLPAGRVPEPPSRSQPLPPLSREEGAEPVPRNDRNAPHQQHPRPAQTTHHDQETSGADATRRINVSIPLPRLSGIATAATTGGSTGLLVSFVTGDVQPIYVWPSVTLIALGMLYDLTRRALEQHQRR